MLHLFLFLLYSYLQFSQGQNDICAYTLRPRDGVRTVQFYKGEFGDPRFKYAAVGYPEGDIFNIDIKDCEDGRVRVMTTVYGPEFDCVLNPPGLDTILTSESVLQTTMDRKNRAGCGVQVEEGASSCPNLALRQVFIEQIDGGERDPQKIAKAAHDFLGNDPSWAIYVGYTQPGLQFGTASPLFTDDNFCRYSEVLRVNNQLELIHILAAKVRFGATPPPNRIIEGDNTVTGMALSPSPALAGSCEDDGTSNYARLVVDGISEAVYRGTFNPGKNLCILPTEDGKVQLIVKAKLQCDGLSEKKSGTSMLQGKANSGKCLYDTNLFTCRNDVLREAIKAITRGPSRGNNEEIADKTYANLLTGNFVGVFQIQGLIQLREGSYFTDNDFCFFRNLDTVNGFSLIVGASLA